MTDSLKDLTESVIAGGNLLEGEGAKHRCYYSRRGFYCNDCEYAVNVANRIARFRGNLEHLPDRWLRVVEDHQSHIDFREPKNAPVRVNRYELGPREFTLTYSPTWFANDVEARVALRKAIDKLIKYHRDDIIHLSAVGEVGKNGASHIHCYYELEGGCKITDKNFKRAWRYWDPSKKHGNGFQGGHHETVKNRSDFLGYIDKDIDTAWLEIKYPE